MADVTEMNCKIDLLCAAIQEMPGMGWVKKHCVGCECCEVNVKKKKLKIVKAFKQFAIVCKSFN